MRQNPHLLHPRQKQHFANQQSTSSQQQQYHQNHQHPHHNDSAIMGGSSQLSSSAVSAGPTPLRGGGGAMHQMHGQHSVSSLPTPGHRMVDVLMAPRRSMSNAAYLTQQRSFSSSEEELRSTAEYDGESARTYAYVYIILTKSTHTKFKTPSQAKQIHTTKTYT